MASIDEKISAVAEQVLKRPLTEDEQLEMYKIADAMGMKDVQSFLHQLLVFKMQDDMLGKRFENLHTFEDRLNEKIQELASLETRIYETLDAAVSRILSEGARRIGSDMGDEIASQTKSIFSAVGAYHFLKGQIIVACAICASAVLGYFLGWKDVLQLVPGNRVLQTLLYFPAGWCFFICGITYTFFWIGDNWYEIKRKKWYKALLGGQIIGLLLLALAMI
ncbi:chloride channel protein [Synergistaceae bacterium OttesenSCG-928-I11]|nr:chloride channel protein [Synergistaceae bacterium OttesenSCG-928-I11]